MLEKIEVGKEYLNGNNLKVKVLFVDDESVFYEFSDKKRTSSRAGVALESWSEIPAPKKRYWLWDIKSSSGEIFKSSTYTDENGGTPLGRLSFQKESLIKKHENEWIEV